MSSPRVYSSSEASSTDAEELRMRNMDEELMQERLVYVHVIQWWRM
jgi:hypothetical protein